MGEKNLANRCGKHHKYLILHAPPQAVLNHYESNIFLSKEETQASEARAVKRR